MIYTITYSWCCICIPNWDRPREDWQSQHRKFWPVLNLTLSPWCEQRPWHGLGLVPDSDPKPGEATVLPCFARTHHIPWQSCLRSGCNPWQEQPRISQPTRNNFERISLFPIRRWSQRNEIRLYKPWWRTGKPIINQFPPAFQVSRFKPIRLILFGPEMA